METPSSKKAFDFGENWKHFSANALDNERFIIAKESLEKLIGVLNIKEKSFLDIGSGSGIFSLAAKKLGAKRVAGFDISQNSVESAYFNKNVFAKDEEVDFYKQSIMDPGYDKWGKFDIVYSWGVLHHTGDMYKAITNSIELVERGGLFVLALYNRHWTSPLWEKIKWFYNVSPKFVQRLMVWFFYCIIALAKFAVTWKNPFKKKKRGMDYYYDVVDWVGGYPYEYASCQEIKDFLEKRGFQLEKCVRAQVPTGCNEFVFRRKS